MTEAQKVITVSVVVVATALVLVGAPMAAIGFIVGAVVGDRIYHTLRRPR